MPDVKDQEQEREGFSQRMSITLIEYTKSVLLQGETENVTRIKTQQLLKKL